MYCYYSNNLEFINSQTIKKHNKAQQKSTNSLQIMKETLFQSFISTKHSPNHHFLIPQLPYP